MNSIEIFGIASVAIGMTNPPDELQEDLEILKDYNLDKNFYKKVVLLKDKVIGVILVGNIDRAGIYNGLIKNKVDVTDIKENLIKENFGVIQLPSEYKKHLVVGEGIEV